MINLVVGACLGAALGATLGWSIAAAVANTDAGVGYGGTAGTLQVVVQGEAVHVSGAGFLANSLVAVSVGDLSATVPADEFGRIDAHLDAADPSGSLVTAVGSSPTGESTTLHPTPLTAETGTTATMLGASAGATPALFAARRRRR
jgi:hypothetical protein